MTRTTSATELQSQYVELKVCINQCEAHLSRMMVDGLLAMELAAIVRHEAKLRELERDLRRMKVPVPVVDTVMPQSAAIG
jgi:hypothetical protein